MNGKEKQGFRLGDLVTLKRGYDLPERMRTQGDYPIVSSSGVIGSHNEFKVEGPGVVTGRYGTLGEVFFIPQHFWPLNTSLYVQDFKGNDPKFVYYYLDTVLSSNFNAAGAVPGVNRNALHKLEVPKPPKDQKKIAAILSAYDDLIENNKRRIALLEKMAEEIYREWFVRMRFPGYEKVKFEKGVPSNWIFTSLGEIANFTMGQSPKSEFYNETGDGLPFNQGVGTYGERFPKKVTYCTSNGRRAKKGNILFSVRAPVGRLNIADCEMIIGRGLAAISHKEGFNSYLFYLLKVAFANEDIIGNGAIFNSVGKDELAKFNVLQPDHHLVMAYNKIASNIDKQIALLIRSVEKLVSVRDLLLSRLISGKLSVENLDIQFPPSMLDEKHPARESHIATIAVTG
jgi:type I restriction enzyme S subunit